MMKKMISILLCATILLGTFFGLSTATAAETPDSIGDVDGNGKIEVIDATLIQRHLSGLRQLDAAAQKRGSVSGGEELAVIDVTLIQRYLAGMITRFPVEDKQTVAIHFTNNKKWDKVYAYLFNKTTGEAQEAYPGVELTDPVVNGDGLNEYSLTVDVSKYDRVIFNNNKVQSIEAPVTKASYGYFIGDKNSKKYDLDIYTGEQYGKGTIKTVKMDYPGYDEGVKKTVWIYLPEGYDPADTGKKYSVLYFDDGQVILGTMPNDDWRCDKTVRSMMNNGCDGVILVGISSLEGERDREMRPYIDISTVDPEIAAEHPGVTEEELIEMYKEYCDGNTFADFTVNTVIPYVESHYHVNSVRGFTGSSGGGLEAFYMGMEYPEVFDYIGVMSPSLNIYSADDWNKYLDKKDFSGKVPRMYFFCGNSPQSLIERDLYPYSVEAESWLLAHQYPSDRILTTTNDDTKHLHKYWGLYLPELLCWGMEL